MASRALGRSQFLLGVLLLVTFPSKAAFSQAPPPRESSDRPSGVPVAPRLPISPDGEPAPEAPPTPPPLTIPSVRRPLFTTTAPSIAPAATFAFQPSVTFGEEYSDNFNLSRQNKQENFRSIFSPTLGLLINSASTTGGVAYSPSVIHDSSSDAISLFHSLLGHTTWKATSRLTLGVSDALTRSDVPTQADNLHLRHERRTFTSNIFSLTSDYLISTLRTREHYQWSVFSDQTGRDTTSHTLGADIIAPLYQTMTAALGYDYLTSETSDRFNITGHQITGSLIRQLTALASAGVGGGYAFRSVTNDEPIDYQIWNVGFLSGYELPDRWLFNSSIGVGGLRSDQGDLGPLLTTQTSLVYRHARGTITLGTDHGYSETFATGQNFGVVRTQGARTELFYSFTPATAGTIAGFYRENQFTGIAGGTGNGTAQIWGGSVSLSVQVRRWLRMDLEYAHIEQTAVPRQNAYSENRARLFLSLQFY